MCEPAWGELSNFLVFAAVGILMRRHGLATGNKIIDRLDGNFPLLVSVTMKYYLLRMVEDGSHISDGCKPPTFAFVCVARVLLWEIVTRDEVAATDGRSTFRHAGDDKRGCVCFGDFTFVGERSARARASAQIDAGWSE